MKNKTWIDIAQSLDKGRLPRSDAWHAENYIRTTVAQGGQAPQTPGYYSSYMGTQTAGSIQQSLYTRLNSELNLMFPDIKAVSDLFKQAGLDKATETPPSALVLALSQVPMTEYKAISAEPGDGSTNDAPQAAVQPVANPDYTCLQIGYGSLPLAVKVQQRWFSYLATYYGQRGAKADLAGVRLDRCAEGLDVVAIECA